MSRILRKTVQKKKINDPDNHDSLITHLEPDILEYEVKRALGRAFIQLVHHGTLLDGKGRYCSGPCLTCINIKLELSDLSLCSAFWIFQFSAHFHHPHGNPVAGTLPETTQLMRSRGVFKRRRCCAQVPGGKLSYSLLSSLEIPKSYL